MVSSLEFKSKTVRGSPGFFRVARTAAGNWWFVDPFDRAFFAAGVTGRHDAPYPLASLRHWHFNVVLTEAIVGSGPNVAWLPSVDLIQAGAVIHSGHTRLPDVFDPGWQDAATARARTICQPWAEERGVIGWRTDVRLEWGLDEPESRPTLLQRCLSLEPSYPAYHAAWEFVLALHGGTVEGLASAWAVPLRNRELLREWTREEKGIRTLGYLADQRRWGDEYARRYYKGAADAIRQAAPQHLVFAPAAGGMGGGPSLDVAPLVDVQVVDWVPSSPLTGEGPFWFAGFGWTKVEVVTRPLERDEPEELTRVELMLRRGRNHFAEMVYSPRVVGWDWTEQVEPAAAHPLLSPQLITPAGLECIHHTEALTWLNARAHAWRAGLR